MNKKINKQTNKQTNQPTNKYIHAHTHIYTNIYIYVNWVDVIFRPFSQTRGHCMLLWMHLFTT